MSFLVIIIVLNRSLKKNSKKDSDFPDVTKNGFQLLISNMMTENSSKRIASSFYQFIFWAYFGSYQTSMAALFAEIVNKITRKIVNEKLAKKPCYRCVIGC